MIRLDTYSNYDLIYLARLCIDYSVERCKIWLRAAKSKGSLTRIKLNGSSHVSLICSLLLKGSQFYFIFFFFAISAAACCAVWSL